MRKTARALPQYLRMHGKLRNDVEYVFQSYGVFALHKFPTAGALLWQNPLQIGFKQLATSMISSQYGERRQMISGIVGAFTIN